jgi:cytochrome c biogenesis protein CcdA
MFQFLLALFAGMVTIGGPCILPLLPIILGTSTTRQHRLRPVTIVLGFTVAFTAFAVIFSVFGSLLGLSPQTWRYVGSILIGLFGLMMLFPRFQAAIFARFEKFGARLRPGAQVNKGGLLSGFILGLSLGVIWTPCAGPVLGSILTLIAAKQNLLGAGALLFAFALGAGIPMLLIAYGGQMATEKVRSLNHYTAIIQKVFGVIILLVAIGIATNTDVIVQSYLLEHFPGLFVGLKLNI